MTKQKTDDVIHRSKEPHNLPCVLTVQERAETANRLAEGLQQLESLEAERKSTLSDFTARTNALKATIHDLTRQVKDGEIMRSVECELQLNFTQLTAILIRSDTADIVEERPLTDKERESQTLYDDAKKK